jgi:hypothetical protein
MPRARLPAPGQSARTLRCTSQPEPPRWAQGRAPNPLARPSVQKKTPHHSVRGPTSFNQQRLRRNNRVISAQAQGKSPHRQTQGRPIAAPVGRFWRVWSQKRGQYADRVSFAWNNKNVLANVWHRGLRFRPRFALYIPKSAKVLFR